MTRKKEAKELIEILLRQQRANRPQRQDPLEGLEWEGLPPELRDRVYRPIPKKEPLVELLSSIEQAGTVETAAPRPRAVEPALPSEEVVEPETERSALPERPGWYERFSDWFFHVFAFLNKSYEVRAATILVFGAAAIFVASLSYLLGRAGTESSFQLHNHVGAVTELSRVPEEEKREREIVRGVTGPNGQKPAEKQPSAPTARKKAGTPGARTLPNKGYAIQISTATNEKEAEKLCAFIRAQGYEDLLPRSYRDPDNKMLLVILGRWVTRSEASAQLKVLKADLFSAMKEKGHLKRLDQIVHRNVITD